MPKMLIGKKLGMSQIFAEDGRLIPVTVIEAGPCFVSQVKTAATDGYEAVQIGFAQAHKPNKPQVGHFCKIWCGSPALCERNAGGRRQPISTWARIKS